MNSFVNFGLSLHLADCQSVTMPALLPFWLSPMFSRHGIAQASLGLLIWLSENIPHSHLLKKSLKIS